LDSRTLLVGFSLLGCDTNLGFSGLWDSEGTERSDFFLIDLSGVADVSDILLDTQVCLEGSVKSEFSGWLRVGTFGPFRDSLSGLESDRYC